VDVYKDAGGVTRIEDYALLGDTHTAALVSRDGSLDWLCLPRFDSGACFAALLGGKEQGRWLIRPAGDVRRITRRYREATLVLETEFETAEGVVRLIDCMPPRRTEPVLVRLVEGVRGSVPMDLELIIRFDYGGIVPWVRRAEGGLLAVAGPDALRIEHGVPLEPDGLTHRASFRVSAGDRVPFSLTWHPSHQGPPARIQAEQAVDQTTAWWREWSALCTYEGEWRGQVLRSLITLKALTYGPTGGIVAAPTTSLPEELGGVRNWDYRYCWLRDATFTLYSLMTAGYLKEAAAWRDWLLRAVAGQPSAMQIMYGPAGERRLPEAELAWLPGYEGSRPVRVGNAAAKQFQLDVYGEVMDAMHQARRSGIDPEPAAWRLQSALLEFLEGAWREPDEGIWEMRGPRRHFTHSKVMAWVAFDRAVGAVERFGLDGPVERWRALRAEVHAEVCREGWDPRQRAFTQYYGAPGLDAALLMMPLVGFLPPSDPRVQATVAAIERGLLEDGLVHRYSQQDSDDVDGLPPGEGVFLACTFWLADNYALAGHTKQATDLFERLQGLCNDVGLLAEEYDPSRRRQVGNFPQAFSHVSLINSATNLSRAAGPARHRSSEAGKD